MPKLRVRRLLKKPMQEKNTDIRRGAFGKERKPQKQVELIVEKYKKGHWKKNGTANRFLEIYIGGLYMEPLSFLSELKTKRPEVLIGGSGEGEDIRYLKNYMKKQGKKIKVDVFNLTPFAGDKKLIRNDLSIGQALETIASNPEKYSEVISKMKGKYDLAVFASGAGMHTLYPPFNVFTAALTIKKGGRVYIEVPTKKFIEVQCEKGDSAYPKDQVKRIENQLDHLNTIVMRMLNSYFKKDVSNEYSIKFLRPSKSKYSIFVRICRQ